MLQTGIENPDGASWQFLSSLLLTAFTFEAYMNHIGPSLFKVWQMHLDRLPPLGKFELLCENLAVSFPGGWGARPLQTVKKLFDFRNTMAHGRPEQLKTRPKVHTVESYHSDLHEEPLTDWEQLIQTASFAQCAREDVSIVLAALHERRPDPKEGLFTFGLGLHSADLVQEP
jgi:hypothetical protein